MNRLIHAVLALIIISSSALAAERPTRFWNLTRHTIAGILPRARGDKELER